MLTPLGSGICLWDTILVIAVPADYLALNTLRQKQNGHNYTDEIFEGIFFNENFGFFNKI